MNGMRGHRVQGPIEADVVVLGGGAAGAAAALVARSLGHEVAVIRRAWGATALSSGAADLAPDPLATGRNPRGEGRSVIACVQALAALRGDHPYAVLRDRLALLPEAAAFASVATDGFLSFGPLGEENRLLCTPIGAVKSSAGGLASVVAGDVREGPLGVVGFASHPEYDAELLTRGLGEAGFEALPVVSDFLHRAEERLLRPHEIAALVEKDFDRFVASLRRAVGEGVARLLLPPVIGLGDPRPLIARLVGELGMPCAERPAGGNSVPGSRLQRVLEERLEAAGVMLFHGEAIAPQGSVGSLEVRDPSPPLPDPARFVEGLGPTGLPTPDAWPVMAGAVVLATGKFIGGGVRRDVRLREPIFDLPVWIGGSIDEGRWLGDLTSGELRDGQPAFRAGVRVDAALRPLNADGRPRSELLFAAGAILGGNDAARDGAGLGLAWFTGWLAGHEAARVVRGT